LSQFKLAQKSVDAKKSDRYREVVENYKTFIDQYPGSKFLKDAEKLYIESNVKITTLKNTNS
jgi:outer membrane protein assembly factor BamD